MWIEVDSDTFYFVKCLNEGKPIRLTNIMAVKMIKYLDQYEKELKYTTEIGKEKTIFKMK